jgi:pentatricopeptide repeat protein
MYFRGGLIRVGRTVYSRHRLPELHNEVANTSAITFTGRRHMGSLDVPTHTKLEFLASQLHASTRMNHLAEVHRIYPALVDIIKVKNSNSTVAISALLNRRQFTDVFSVLGASGRPFDLALIERILSDMPVVFALQPTTEDHTTIIRALIRHGNIQTVQRWLVSMPKKPGHITPSHEHWHLFLEYCGQQGELGSLRSAIKSMRRSGSKPINASFQILINALFESTSGVPRLAEFSSIMDDMKQEGLPYEPSILLSLCRGYTDRRHRQLAIQVERLYLSRFSKVRGKGRESLDWNKRLEEESHKRGARAAVQLCKIFQQKGFVASPFTLSSILRASASSSDLHHAAKELGIRANVIHWSIVIRNAIRTGDMKRALAIYSQSQESGILPDAAMVHPIISALCQTTLKPPADTAIDQALALYQDLVRASSQPRTDVPASSGGTTINLGHSSGPDANIYNALLRGLSSSPNVSKCYPLATSLLDDMESRNVSLDNSMATTSLTILLMRNSSSPSEAFDIYRRVCKSGRTTLDATGYGVLLNAFCKLSFGDQSLPSLHHYFEMVKDMRNLGHGVTVEVYTILLRQLATLATRMTSDKSLPEDFAENLVAAVRRAHNHLTVDASVSPDAALWNQLMDTYQRAGCFGEAYRVWEMTYLSGTFDNTSVSIILDACGHAGAWPIAAQICMKLLKDGFPFNQRNWNAWLECLCRLGKLNEAVKIVCLEMGKHQDDVAPNEESIRILLSFAAKVNQQHEVQSRIKRYLPDVWQTLPLELRGSL